MTKQTNTTKHQETDEATLHTAFQVPFTREAFRRDVANVFLYYVRSIAWMTDHDTAWAILKLPQDEASYPLYRAEFDAAELNVTFEHIRQTEFAKALERMYEYAYYGRKNHNEEPLEHESIHTWISCLLCDAREGHMASEWDSYGWYVKESAERCAQVAETANARVTLEGGEPFFQEFQRSSKEGFLSENLLTIRQVSLLSGMEEMSIRASANPKRQNPLKTITTEHGTRVEIGVAKAWLQSKGRYIPISDIWTAGEIDLVKYRFEDYGALDGTLQARYRLFCNERDRKGLDAEFAAANITTKNGVAGPILDLSVNDYHNEEQIRVVARVLELPAELLVLRVKETLAQENLRLIERALREATQNLK